MKAIKYVMLLVAFFAFNACDNNQGQNGFDTHDKNDNDYEAPATTPPNPDNTMPPATPPSTSDTSFNDTSNRNANP